MLPKLFGKINSKIKLHSNLRELFSFRELIYLFSHVNLKFILFLIVNNLPLDLKIIPLRMLLDAMDQKGKLLMYRFYT